MRHLKPLLDAPARNAAGLDHARRVVADARPGALLESLRGTGVAALCLLFWLACSSAPEPTTSPIEEAAASFIVQGTDLATVTEAVRDVGGELTHELAVIRAVGARLTPSQRTALESLDGITRVWEDRSVNLQAP